MDPIDQIKEPKLAQLAKSLLALKDAYKKRPESNKTGKSQKSDDNVNRCEAEVFDAVNNLCNSPVYHQRDRLSTLRSDQTRALDDLENALSNLNLANLDQDDQYQQSLATAIKVLNASERESTPIQNDRGNNDDIDQMDIEHSDDVEQSTNNVLASKPRQERIVKLSFTSRYAIATLERIYSPLRRSRGMGTIEAPNYGVSLSSDDDLPDPNDRWRQLATPDADFDDDDSSSKGLLDECSQVAT